MLKKSLRPVMLLLALAITALVVAGCGSSNSTSGTTQSSATGNSGGASAAAGGAAGTIDAKLDEWSIDTNSPDAKSGKVSFDADNVGKLPHELVVLKTDQPAGSLKVTNGQVSEKDSVGAIRDVNAGQSKSDSLDLKPGKYVLICNLPGHYQAGMYTSLTVK